MTDRIRHLTVVLEHDFREDDVEAIIDAIRLIRGVGDVQTHAIDSRDAIALMRVRTEIYNQALEAFHRVFFPEDAARRKNDGDT